jgi:hypothetical protein
MPAAYRPRRGLVVYGADPIYACPNPGEPSVGGDPEDGLSLCGYRKDADGERPEVQRNIVADNLAPRRRASPDLALALALAGGLEPALVEDVIVHVREYVA